MTDLKIGPYHDPKSAPGSQKWDLTLLTNEVYCADRLGDEWWLPYTDIEQEEHKMQSRVPKGPDVIYD